MAAAAIVHDITPTPGLEAGDDPLVPALQRAFGGRPGVRLLPRLGLPVAGGAEHMGAVVVHRGGFILLRRQGQDAIPCLRDSGTTPEAEPCRPVIDARRQGALLRHHVAERAVALLSRRLRSASFAAALPVDVLVVAEAADADDEADATGATACLSVVRSAEAVVERLERLLARPPRRDRLGRRLLLRVAEVEAIAAHLERVHVAPPRRPPPSVFPDPTLTWPRLAAIGGVR